MLVLGGLYWVWIGRFMVVCMVVVFLYSSVVLWFGVGGVLVVIIMWCMLFSFMVVFVILVSCVGVLWVIVWFVVSDWLIV